MVTSCHAVSQSSAARSHSAAARSHSAAASAQPASHSAAASAQPASHSAAARSHSASHSTAARSHSASHSAAARPHSVCHSRPARSHAASHSSAPGRPGSLDRFETILHVGHRGCEIRPTGSDLVGQSIHAVDQILEQGRQRVQTLVVHFDQQDGVAIQGATGDDQGAVGRVQRAGLVRAGHGGRAVAHLIHHPDQPGEGDGRTRSVVAAGNVMSGCVTGTVDVVVPPDASRSA